MDKSIKYLASLLIVFLCHLSNSQSKDLKFENFSTTQGVPHYSINHILEDQYGFLWFATNSGLFRYDGNKLRSFLHNINDPSSVSSPGIEHIVEDRKGQIWASTMYGINLLDRRTGTFTRFYPFPEDLSSKGNNIISHLVVDQENRLFALGSDHLYLFNQETQDFQVINEKYYSPKYQKIKSMIASENGTIWCAAETGILKISPGSDYYSFIRIDSNDTYGLNSGIDLVADAGDHYLYINTDKGLVKYDTESRNVIQDILPPEFRIFKTKHIAKTNDGKLLLAFENNGLGVLWPNGSFKHYVHHDNEINSLQNNQVRCIVNDQFGNIWLGTSVGISKVSFDHSGFEIIQNEKGLDKRANNVNRVLKSRQGDLWMNTEVGVYFKSSTMPTGQPFHLNSQLGKAYQVDYFFEDAEGNIMVSVFKNGLWEKKANSEKFAKLNLGSQFEDFHIYKIIGDQANPNIFWLGTSDGIAKWNRKNNQVKLFKPIDQHPFLQSNRAIVMSEWDNHIWLYYTYNNSIGYFDKISEKFEVIEAPKQKQYMLEGVFRDVVVSKEGKVWFATNFGLLKYSIEEKHFEIFTKQNGLLDNDLNAVIIDQHDQLWVAGQRFIARFYDEDQKFTSYDESKKVKKFLSRSGTIAEDGQVLLGCLNGVFAFYPDSIDTAIVTPDIVLTDFKVRDATFLLDQAFEDTKHIELKHDQNDIAFEFSAINNLAPLSIQYWCLLEGYDETWRKLGNDHYVSYTNLNPGQFKFRLNASNADGFWGENELSIDVKIAPPFTHTYWFRALVLLLFLGIILFLFRIRKKSVLLKNQKEIAEKSAAYKTRFLADVSHEIRTPMNAIIGLSKLTLETDLDEKQANFVGAIQESSKSLLSIINDLLDHTKLEAGKFTFVKKAFDLGDITRMIGNTFNHIADEKHLSFDVNVYKDNTYKLIGDPIRLNQILTNLLGNAFKFTESGKVWLLVEKQEESDQSINLRFEVGDTGIGIEKNKLKSIFDLYSQAEEGINKGMEGTGLGLSIALQMVEKLGGHLYINSELGIGTKLWFVLPFEKLKNPKKLRSTSEREFTLNAVKVLVVEDTYFNQMLVVEILKKHVKDPEIDIAENGKIALEKIDEQDFDIILMDVKMQVMDGFETSRRIRKLEDETKKNIPILAVTASAVPEQLLKCKAAGMDDFVTKPIDENELIEKMHHLIEKRFDRLMLYG